MIETDVDPTRPISPEQRLFLGVLMNAALEAAGRPREIAAQKNVAEVAEASQRWFRRADKDYQLVCTLAGLEPDHVRTAVLDYVARVEADPASAPRSRAQRKPRRPHRSDRVTLADVARHAEVSRATAQNVWGNKIPVSAALRARVLQAIDELGYTPKETHSVH